MQYDVAYRSTKAKAQTQEFPNQCDYITIRMHIYAIGGVNTNQVYQIHTHTYQVIQKSHLLMGKYSQGLCFNNYTIYSIGGWIWEPVNDCQCYETQLNQWHHLPQLIAPRHLNSVCYKNNSLYAFGGNSSQPDNAMETYTIGQDSWKHMEIKNIIAPRICSAMMCVNDNIFIIGGYIS